MEKKVNKEPGKKLDKSSLLPNALEKELLGMIKGGAHESDFNADKNANNGEGD